MAKGFLTALHSACPIRITLLLTDNGKEFTDRLFGSRDRQATGNHEFDPFCQAIGIEHRFTQPRSPSTHGRVACCHGRIPAVLATHRFDGAKDLETTRVRDV